MPSNLIFIAAHLSCVSHVASLELYVCQSPPENAFNSFISFIDGFCRNGNESFPHNMDGSVLFANDSLVPIDWLQNAFEAYSDDTQLVLLSGLSIPPFPL